MFFNYPHSSNSPSTCPTPTPPWTSDPSVLFWPLTNLLNISPFERHQSCAERLNAQSRLVILLTVIFCLFLHQRRQRREVGALLAFAAVVYVAHLGYDYEFNFSQPSPYPENTLHRTVVQPVIVKKEFIEVPSKNSSSSYFQMGDDPSRSPQVVVSAPSSASMFSHDPSLEAPHIESPMTMIAKDQRAFRSVSDFGRGLPTRFDAQNHAMKLHQYSGPSIQAHFTPHRDLGRLHPNPGPFDFGRAVTSTQPPSVTYETSYLERMMRDVDEVDPGLVTNPLPDPTFMARQPTFDHSAEQSAVDRSRFMGGSRMRFY